MEEKLTRNKQNLFLIGFCIYYISMILEDVAVDYGILPRVMHYIAYSLFVLNLFLSKISSTRIKRIAIVFLVSAFASLFTRDFYWVALSVILLSSNVDVKKTFQISQRVIIIAGLIVIFFLAIGLLPNLVTVRGGETGARYGLGFYHSDVFPMIIFYALTYRLVLLKKHEKIKLYEIVAWILVTLVVYIFCRSRNGLYGTAFCLGLYMIRGIFKEGSKQLAILRIMSRCSIIVLILASIILTCLQGTGNKTIYMINKMFTGRFAIAYHQMRRSGFKVLGLLSKTEYREIAGVLDNGYLYVALRYGLIFLLFYVVLQFIICKKYKDNIIVLIVMISIAVVNMVDNDLISYGFLPYIILGSSKRYGIEIKKYK